MFRASPTRYARVVEFRGAAVGGLGSLGLEFRARVWGGSGIRHSISLGRTVFKRRATLP